MVIERVRGAFTKSSFKTNFPKCNHDFYSKCKHLFLIKCKVDDESCQYYQSKRVHTYSACFSSQLSGEFTSFFYQNYDLCTQTGNNQLENIIKYLLMLYICTADQID